MPTPSFPFNIKPTLAASLALTLFWTCPGLLPSQTLAAAQRGYSSMVTPAAGLPATGAPAIPSLGTTLLLTTRPVFAASPDVFIAAASGQAASRPESTVSGVEQLVGKMQTDEGPSGSRVESALNTSFDKRAETAHTASSGISSRPIGEPGQRQAVGLVKNGTPAQRLVSRAENATAAVHDPVDALVMLNSLSAATLTFFVHTSAPVLVLAAVISFGLATVIQLGNGGSKLSSSVETMRRLLDSGERNQTARTELSAARSQAKAGASLLRLAIGAVAVATLASAWLIAGSAPVWAAAIAGAAAAAALLAHKRTTQAAQALKQAGRALDKKHRRPRR